MLVNKKEKQALRLYSIADHGKGKVDHVGDVTKIFIKRAVSNDYFLD